MVDVFNRSFLIIVPLIEAPESVPHTDYHRHIHPDLPGPVRMRQLLVWAAQEALKDIEVRQQSRLAPESLIEAAQALIQGLMTNEVNTSWYQRPSNTPVLVL